MPDELKSFLISVSVILAVALFVPIIESIVKLVRRSHRSGAQASLTPPAKPAKRLSGEAA